MSKEFTIYNEKQKEFYNTVSDLTEEQRLELLKKFPEALNLTLATIMLAEESKKDPSLDFDDWECSFDSLLFGEPEN